MTDSAPKRDDAYFTSICIDDCGGRCCDPWWGINEFTLTSESALKGLGPFLEKIEREVLGKVERIQTNYVTTEDPPRPLFREPERYYVEIINKKLANGASLL